MQELTAQEVETVGGAEFYATMGGIGEVAVGWGALTADPILFAAGSALLLTADYARFP